MGKITRFIGNLAAFASAATGTNRTIFGPKGTATQSDDITDNINPDYLGGWELLGPSDKPTKQQFNALGFTHGQLLAYLHQVGVAEWDGAQEYQIGSIANRSGTLYSCKTADHVSATPPESDPANWRPVGGAKYTEISASNPAWTPSQYTKALFIKAVGAGGGGGGVVGGAVSTAAASGGGGAGGFIELGVGSSDIDPSYNIVIGAGGSGGSGGSNGGDGGNTTINSSSLSIVCNGGVGGISASATSGDRFADGGGGGTVTTTPLGTPSGAIAVRGGSGFRGVSLSGSPVVYGAGGGGAFAGSVSPVAFNVDGLSNNVGGGGSGAVVEGANPNRAGGNGGNGKVAILEIF